MGSAEGSDRGKGQCMDLYLMGRWAASVILTFNFPEIGWCRGQGDNNHIPSLSLSHCLLLKCIASLSWPTCTVIDPCIATQAHLFGICSLLVPKGSCLAEEIDFVSGM